VTTRAFFLSQMACQVRTSRKGKTPERWSISSIHIIGRTTADGLKFTTVHDPGPQCPASCAPLFPVRLAILPCDISRIFVPGFHDSASPKTRSPHQETHIIVGSAQPSSKDFSHGPINSVDRPCVDVSIGFTPSYYRNQGLIVQLYRSGSQYNKQRMLGPSPNVFPRPSGIPSPFVGHVGQGKEVSQVAELPRQGTGTQVCCSAITVTTRLTRAGLMGPCNIERPQRDIVDLLDNDEIWDMGADSRSQSYSAPPIPPSRYNVQIPRRASKGMQCHVPFETRPSWQQGM